MHAVGVAIGLGIDRATGRIRPPLAYWAGAAGGFGFPAGHTTAVTVAAGLIGWTVTRHLRSVRGRVVVWVVAAAWAGGVGWSRVWLGVHWPTDVRGAGCSQARSSRCPHGAARRVACGRAAAAAGRYPLTRAPSSAPIRKVAVRASAPPTTIRVAALHRELPPM